MAYKAIVSLTFILLITIRSSYEYKEYSDEETADINMSNSDCKPEVSAVLLECPKPFRTRHNLKEDDKVEKRACETQMMVNVRVNPSFHIKKLEKFLVLDEVYDPQKRSKAKIMSPYLIELSRGEPIMMYPLQFAKNVKVGDSDTNCATPKEENYQTTECAPEETTETTEPTCATSTTEASKTCKPSNKDSSTQNMSAAEEESLNRVMQKINQAFKPVTKVTNNKFKNKGRIKEPFTSVYKPPQSTFENGYGTLNIENKYPSVWNKQDRFMHHKKPSHSNRKAIFRKIFMGPLQPNRLFDDLTANVGVEKSFAKRLQNNKLAQLGIIMPLRESRKTDKVETNHKYVQSVMEDNDNEQYQPRSLKDVYYDNYSPEEIPMSSAMDTGDMFDECQEKVVEKIVHPIERRTKGKFVEKNQKFRRKYKQNSDKKAIFKSCECKQADVPNSDSDSDAEIEENKLSTSDDNSPNRDTFEEELKEEDTDNNILPAGRLYRKEKPNSRSRERMKKRRNGIFNKPHQTQMDDLSGNEMLNIVNPQGDLHIKDEILTSPRDIHSRSNLKINSNEYTQDVDDDDELYYYLNGDYYRRQMQERLYNHLSPNIEKPSEKDMTVSSMKSHNEELYQPIIFDNFLKNPAVISKFNNYQSKKLEEMLQEANKVPEEKSDFRPDFMKPHRTNFIKNHKYPNAFRSMFPHASKMSNEAGGKDKSEGQFSHIYGDRNLNMDDKMGIMNSVLSNGSDTIKLDELSEELENTHQHMATPYPYPIREGKIPRGKHKRSFLFYDDMEVPENVAENQAFHDHMLPVLTNIRQDTLPIDDGIQPCATCGGKGRKMKPPKTEPEMSSADNFLNGNEPSNSCKCLKREASISDSWYSVYNMSAPLPYLTTQVKIFRKRHGVWWRIVPSITLNSLSGIFANANLSILFSSHVDIFQFEKSLHLQNNQLLVPKGERYMRDVKYFHADVKLEDDVDTNLKYNLNVNPDNILVANPLRLNSENIILNKHEMYKRNDLSSKKLHNNIWHELIDQFRTLRDMGPNVGIKKIIDLGYFPTTMNVLEHCPTNKHRLCLNMLDDRVPSFNIKIKMPFRENGLIYQNLSLVKIAKITTDATTKDALQVIVDVINEGQQVREFSICICNCPTPCASAAKTTVQKVLMPHIRETVSFLLPLIMENNNMKRKKFHCDVIVKTPIVMSSEVEESETEDIKNRDNSSTSYVKKRFSSVEPKQKIVAVRQLDVEPESRCLCVWKCKCHCIPKLETNVDFNVCQELDEKSQRIAGLIDNDDNEDIGDEMDHRPSSSSEKQTSHEISSSTTTSSHIEIRGFFWNALLLILLMLLLGLLKAIFGLCIRPIDKFGYNYVQPARPYKYASRRRRFCVNTFFFIIFPFLFWCKCFTPNEEDLLIASTEWPCSHDKDNSKSSKSQSYKYSESDDDEDDIILSQHIDLSSCKSKSTSRGKGGLDVPSLHGISDLGLNDDIFDIEFDDDEEANTKFVLKALAESRESLRRLHKENTSNYRMEEVSEESLNKNKNAQKAEEFVNKLNSAQIVYRVFDQPYGNLQYIPPNFKYCVQGYFLPCIGPGYEFVNYNPLAQHRYPSSDGCSMQALRPPVLLCPKDFSRRYADKYEVFKAGDLSMQPPIDAPCINLSTMASVATSVANLASEHSRESVFKAISNPSSLPSPLLAAPAAQRKSTNPALDSAPVTVQDCTSANLSDTQTFNEQLSPTQWSDDSYLCTEINVVDDDFLLRELEAIQNKSNFRPHNIDTIPE